MAQPLASIDMLVELYTSGNEVPLESLNQLIFKDALTVRKDLQSFKKPDAQRIFTNRSLRLDKIDYVGFDMDYTVAIYTPAYEEFCYNMIIENLIKMGYPQSISTLPFDPTFSIRGLFIDQELGNILKVDSFGSISVCVHGKKVVPKETVAKSYLSMRIPNEDIGKRFYLLNTLFSTPEACVFANLVDLFESSQNVLVSTSPPPEESDDNYVSSPTQSNFDLSYENLWNDVHTAMDTMHIDGTCKAETLKDLPKYVYRSDRLSKLLDKLRASGKTTFLLTNSPWEYTNRMMSYLLDGFNPERKSWRDYWDIVIVNAGKPAFFASGSTLREVDPLNGKLSLSKITGSFVKGKVYSSGNLSTFERLAGVVNGHTVLYVGDHIFADVRVSKKKRGWRTMLIVPELERELKIWSRPATQQVFSKLYSLQSAKAMIYRDLDSNTLVPPDVGQLQHAISITVDEKDGLYNKYFGSLFSSGLKSSFFSQQVLRYACIYAASYENLLNYPMFYSFTSDSSLLPHETVINLASLPSNGSQSSGLASSSSNLSDSDSNNK